MVKWLRDNLTWIVATVATLLMGFAAGQVKVTYLEKRIEALEAAHLAERMSAVEARLEERKR